MEENATKDEHIGFYNFEFDDSEKEYLINKFAIELPALRGKIGASQGKIAEAVGISRQTYNAYETMTRPIPWNVYLALLFYFDKNPGTHKMMRQLNLLPMIVDKT